MFDWAVWVAWGLVLIGQVITCRSFWQMGRRSAKQEAHRRIDAMGNVADGVLAIMDDLDAVALVTCSVQSRERLPDGLTSEELLMSPCWATRSKTAEPCLSEVARGLRMLADRIDNDLAKSGFDSIRRSDLPAPVLN